MSNKNYVDYYVEILTNTISEAVIKNVSLQANARVTDDIIGEQSGRLEALETEIGNLRNGQSSKIASLEQTIDSLQKQIGELNVMRDTYENVKHQVNHVDTFRNELVKERDEHQKTHNEYENKIKELNDKIEYLQLTPAKRKKIDETKNSQPVDVFLNNNTEILKDGGSF
jgi:chromosome segregation ATPase